MAAKIQMIGWNSKGLRCPDYSLSFENEGGKTHPVSLIQMPNGTGKTTTLELLRAALSGTAEKQKWDADKVRSFKKKKNPQSNGEFQVIFLSNGNRVTITLVFDFDEGTVKYTTTVGKGKRAGFHPPRECMDFLNPDFINFFVFDGELAQQLLDPNHTNAERVIKCLYGLRHFDAMIALVDDYWNKTVKAATAKDTKGLTQRQNKVKYLKDRIDKLVIDQAEKLKKLEKRKNELESLSKKYEAKIRENDHYSDEYNDKKAIYENSIKELESITQQLLKEVRSPHVLSSVFGNDIISLKNNLDKVKLPESTAKEFFEELANEEFCVCGRLLDDEHRTIIKERATNYLGTDEMALLNNLKSEIAAQVGTDPEVHANEFSEKISKYKLAIQERIKAKTDLDAVEEALTNGNTELQDAKSKIEELRTACQELTDELKKYKDKDESQGDDNTFGIEVLRKRFEIAEQKLAEITKTVEVKKKTVALKKILKDALQTSQSQIAENIKDESNSRIKKILPNNDILISKIDKALHLEGQDAGSVGETLSVAYSFLGTLFNSTERQLPFIVDSPANAIDVKVRTEVSQIIPKLTDQFIAFTISSEREGFIAPMDKTCTGKVQYTTLFRKGDQALEEESKKYGKALYTADGVCLESKEFFVKFQKESEMEE